MINYQRPVFSLVSLLPIIVILSGCMGLHPTRSTHIVRSVGLSNYVPSGEQAAGIEKLRVRAIEIKAPKADQKLHSNYVRNQVSLQAYGEVKTRHSVDYVVRDDLNGILKSASGEFFVIDPDSEYTAIAALPVAMRISWRRDGFFCGRQMIVDVIVGLSFDVKSETSEHKKISSIATKREGYCGRGLVAEIWPLEGEVEPIFQSAYQDAVDDMALKFSGSN